MTFTISDEILDGLIGDAKTQGDLFGEGGLIKEMKWTRPIYQTASIFCAIIN